MPPATDSELGRKAVEMGLLAPEALDECLNLRSRLGGTLRMHVLSRGYMDEAAWKSLRGRQADPALGPTMRFPADQLGRTVDIRDPEEEGREYGRYTLVAELGRGGMGVVYKAWDPVLDRHVALKMLLAQDSTTSDDAVQRFVREARSVARLRHPNIVQILDIGCHRDRTFFTMEFVEGSSLEALFEEPSEVPELTASTTWVDHDRSAPLDRFEVAGPLPLSRALLLVRSIASALQYAHEHGIVHRDVKPANILIDSSGTPLLTDFGLAKDVAGIGSASLTASGMLVGTPAYMSPEQARGRSLEIGPATDVYSLGAVFYELLTGRAPFVQDSIPDLLVDILQSAPVAPSRALGRRLPAGCDEVCLRALEKDPARRHDSAAEFGADAERILMGESVAVPRTRSRPRGGTSGRRPRRRRARGGGAAAIAVGGVLAFATVLVLALALGESDPELPPRESPPAHQPPPPDPRKVDVALQPTAEPPGRAEAKKRYEQARFRPVENREAWEGSIRLLDEAIELDPAFGEACFERALLRMRLGRFDEAKADFRKAIELGTAVVIAEYSCGWIDLIVREDRDDADPAFARAEAADPAHDFGRMASLWRFMMNERFDEALEGLRRFDPAGAIGFDVQFARGYALLRLRRYDEACEFLDRAIELRPEFALPRIQRALALIQLRRLEEARQDALAARELSGDAPRALEIHAYVVMQADGNFLEGRRLLDEALDKGGPRLHSLRWMRAQASSGLGALYERNGEPEAARTAYQEGLVDLEELLATPGDPLAPRYRELIAELRRRIEALR